MNPAGAPRGSSRRGELTLLFIGMILAVLALEAGSWFFLRRAPVKQGYAPVRGRRSREPLNTLGYRDVEHARATPKGVHRAIFIGDSFTYGVGVLFDDTYPKRVERALSESRHEPWESIVFAVPGIDSEQEGAILENEAMAFSPDLVVLGYVLNDAEAPDAAERRRAAQWEEAEHARLNPPWWRRSALLSLIADRMNATRENRARVRNHLDLYRDGAPGFISARRSIERMATLCRNRGIPFVVLVFPLLANPMDDRYPFLAAHRKVDAVCQSLGIPVVDLLPSYRDLDWRLLAVEGERDEHPNELAHRIATQALVEALDPILRTAAARSSAQATPPPDR